MAIITITENGATKYFTIIGEANIRMATFIKDNPGKTFSAGFLTNYMAQGGFRPSSVSVSINRINATVKGTPLLIEKIGRSHNTSYQFPATRLRGDVLSPNRDALPKETPVTDEQTAGFEADILKDLPGAIERGTKDHEPEMLSLPADDIPTDSNHTLPTTVQGRDDENNLEPTLEFTAQQYNEGEGTTVRVVDLDEAIPAAIALLETVNAGNSEEETIQVTPPPIHATGDQPRTGEQEQALQLEESLDRVMQALPTNFALVQSVSRAAGRSNVITFSNGRETEGFMTEATIYRTLRSCHGNGILLPTIEQLYEQAINIGVTWDITPVSILELIAVLDQSLEDQGLRFAFSQTDSGDILKSPLFLVSKTPEGDEINKVGVRERLVKILPHHLEIASPDILETIQTIGDGNNHIYSPGEFGLLIAEVKQRQEE